MSKTSMPSPPGAGLRGAMPPCGCGCHAMAASEPVIVADVAVGVCSSPRDADALLQPQRGAGMRDEGAPAYGLPSLVPI